MRRLLKILGYSLVFVLIPLLGLLAYIEWGLAPVTPHPISTEVLRSEREKAGENFYRIGNNWLKKSNSGIWEEYVEGEPFERGVIAGKLEKELLYTQEVAFVEQIHQLVPNDTYLKFLHLFTRIFNRHLEENVAEENKLEIYGESFSAPHEFDYISPAYDRMLNYHAAHDIGHALQNFALVGCSSFAAWGSHTTDSTLLIGRNCDFSMGDKFAENKIVYFCSPKQGHKFAMITWAGMMGCISGMNEAGITVTINAAKSDMPSQSATPISLLAREILQYAGNINEAFSIAKKRKTFVSETLMIGSAADHRTVLIEKSPTRIAQYNAVKNYILCTNHYQSDTFKNDKNNIENIASSASMYRFERLQELMDRNPKLDYLTTAKILRDQQGQHDKNIGVGNEKALNQLLCHHSVIFQPEKLRMWVSANPYQLGEYVCYDLKKIFAETPGMKENKEINEADLIIPADSFLLSDGWKGFLNFKELKQEIKDAIHTNQAVSNENKLESEMSRANPEYWETYYWLGEYFKTRKNKTKATQYLKAALTKEVNDKIEVEQINKEIKELN